jgi:hypothetical protein
MDRLKNTFLKLFLVLGYLLCLSCAFINAQDIGITNRVTDQKRIGGGSRTSGSSRQPVRVIPQPIYITRETTKLIKPTGLYVTVLPNADIVLESIDSGKKINRKVKATTGVLSFEDLRPGTYKMTSSLSGYESQEATITIKSQKITTIPITLKQVTHNFSIKTNVAEGEVRFAPVTVLSEENPDGTVKVKEKGGFCMVPIINGKATIEELAEGDYLLDVRAKDVEYQPERAVIKIPIPIPLEKTDSSNKDELFSINLDYKLSKDTFNQINTPDSWILPVDWKVDSRGLKGSTPGMALPKSDNFRYYKDFEINSSVRLLDNASIGFVLRAVDDKNYYLIKLTGASSTEQPYRISGFIVKNGESKRLMDNPVNYLADTINEQKYFSVVIKAKGDTFEVTVENSTNGQSYPLGKFSNDSFPIGAVGFKITEKSSFEVNRFSVCNEVCK